MEIEILPTTKFADKKYLILICLRSGNWGYVRGDEFIFQMRILQFLLKIN